MKDGLFRPDPKNIPERLQIMTDYGDITNLALMFESECEGVADTSGP